MTPFISSTFWALTVCDIYICICKISKFLFMGSTVWSILVCKTPEFWRWKLRDQNFVPFDSGNIHIKESKKTGFTFLVKLRTKFASILWSTIILWISGHISGAVDKVWSTNFWSLKFYPSSLPLSGFHSMAINHGALKTCASKQRAIMTFHVFFGYFFNNCATQILTWKPSFQ